MAGKKAGRHLEKGDALTPDEWKSLPARLSDPQTVIWDTVNKTLLYVYPALSDPRRVKIAVQMNHAEKGRAAVESVRAAFKVMEGPIAAGIKGSQYIIVRGKL